MTDKSQEISSYKPLYITHYWLDPEIERLYKRVIRSSNS